MSKYMALTRSIDLTKLIIKYKACVVRLYYKKIKSYHRCIKILKKFELMVSCMVFIWGSDINEKMEFLKIAPWMLLANIFWYTIKIFTASYLINM